MSHHGNLASAILELDRARADACGALRAYFTPLGENAEEKCILESGVRDEFNEAPVAIGAGQGTAEQARRLSARPAAGGERSKRAVVEMEADIERSAMASIDRRCSGSPDGAKRAMAERQLFNYRVASRAYEEGGSVGARPQPGHELADRIIAAARNDAAYQEAIRANAPGARAFLIGSKRGAAEALLFRAMFNHNQCHLAVAQARAEPHVEGRREPQLRG